MGEYKLLKEDENSYHLQHPEGHKIQIAKSAISDALHQKIKSYYKGGEVDGEDAGSKAMAALGATGEDDPLLSSSDVPKPDGFMEDIGAGLSQARDTIVNSLPESPNIYDDAGKTPNMSSYYDKTPDVVAGPPGPAIASNDKIPRDSIPSGVRIGGEATPQGNQPTTSASGAIQNPKTGMLADMEKIQGAEQKAIGAKAASESQMYKEHGRLAGLQQIEQEQAYNAHVATMARNERELGQLSQSVMDQKIDPNKLWHEAGTGGKIAASIGIILGGIGAGLTGGPNQALAMVNKMVDRDIDAQKSELGKKQTLYSMNMQKFHNENTAYMATKLQLAATYQGQLAQATAKAQSQVAIQNGTIAQQEISKQMLPMKQELARWQAGQQLLYGQGSGREADQSRAAEMLLPKEDKERLLYVPGPNGKGARPVLAPTKEDAENFRKAEVEHNGLESKIDNAINFMNEHGTLINPFSEAKGASKTLLGSVKMSMSKLHGLNRLSDVDLHEFEKKVPSDLGQMNTKQGIAQLQALKAELQDNRNAAYSQYTPGYNPGKFKGKEGKPVR